MVQRRQKNRYIKRNFFTERNHRHDYQKKTNVTFAKRNLYFTARGNILIMNIKKNSLLVKFLLKYQIEKNKTKELVKKNSGNLAKKTKLKTKKKSAETTIFPFIVTENQQRYYKSELKSGGPSFANSFVRKNSSCFFC